MRFLASGFFHESPSPKPLIITLGSFWIFSKIRGDIRKSRCTTTGGKFATGVNDTGGKPPVSTTRVANLPPVSTTLAANFATSSYYVVDTGGKFTTGVNDTGGKFAAGVNKSAANCHWYQRHRRQICHRCQWHRWQIMGTISGCRHLKVNLKAKIYIYVSFTTQRWPNKIINIFLIEDFFHLPPVSLTPVENLELRISPRIFLKIRNGLNGRLWGWGETDSWKEPEAKNLVTLSL